MISWGRKATLTFGGTNVTNIQDISVGDAANDLTAEARDLAYVIHGVGAKDFSVEFEALMSATDPAGMQAIIDEYDDPTDGGVVVVVRRKAGAAGYTAKMCVLQCQPSYGQGNAAMWSVRLAPADPDALPTRV